MTVDDVAAAGRELARLDALLLHLDFGHGIDPNTVEPGDEESRHEQEHDEET